MRITMMPGFSEMIIIVDPSFAVDRGNMISSIMSWMYGPWPESRSTGIINFEINGNNLKNLLIALGNRYKNMGIDFEPFNNNANDIDPDYSVLVNDQNSEYLPAKLNTELKQNDRITIKILWRWDG